MPAITPSEPKIRIRTPQAEGLRRALAARGIPTTHRSDGLIVAGVTHETLTRLAFERDAVVHEISPT